MTNKSLKHRNIIKENAPQQARSITVGGIHADDLQQKQTIIQKKLNESKMQALKEREDIIKEAIKTSDEIISNAKASEQSIQEKAYEEGFQAGKSQAIAETKEDLQKILLEANNVLLAIEQERKETLEDETNRIYKVIVKIARKLLHKELEMSENISYKFIETAINSLEHKANVNIIINSRLGKELQNIRTKLLSEHPSLENLTINTDSSLKIGEIIIESNKERLDYRLDSQLDELLKQLVGDSNEAGLG